jgi:hypothetical protein
LIGFFVQIGTCCGVCCCTGRRKAIRKTEHEQGYDGATSADSEVSRAPGVGANGVNDVNITGAEKRRRFGFGRR